MQHAGAITGAAEPESLILIIINILFEKGPGSAVAYERPEVPAASI